MIENKLQHCYENYSFLKRIYDIESRPVVGNYGPGEDSEIFNQAGEAYGVASHVEGGGTKTGEYATYAHAEGYESEANGLASHAEGTYCIANGEYSHVEGSATTADGSCSHSEGDGTLASGHNSHAEGNSTTAGGYSSHAEGSYTTADGDSSHSEGGDTIAAGSYSHAEGNYTEAYGDYSHAEGYYTIVGENAPEGQHVEGRCNIEDTDGLYLHITGNGVDEAERSNAFTVDTNGNAVFAGTCTATEHPTTSSKRFKENFREVSSEEIHNIFNLESKKFDYKKEYGGKKDKVGFIAEDVEKLFPNCVSYDPKGVSTGIDYSSFVPYIIEIIKQQAAEIKELKSMIAS